MKKNKEHFSGLSHPSHPSNPSHQTRAARSPGLRPLRAWSAGPRRDIVGTWSKIKTHNKTQILCPPPPEKIDPKIEKSTKSCEFENF